MTTEAATIDDVYATFGRTADTAQALEVDAGNVALATLAFFKQQDENEDRQSPCPRSLGRSEQQDRWVPC